MSLLLASRTSLTSLVKVTISGFRQKCAEYVSWITRSPNQQSIVCFFVVFVFVNDQLILDGKDKIREPALKLSIIFTNQLKSRDLFLGPRAWEPKVK